MFLHMLRDNPQHQFSTLAAACWLLSFGFALMPFDAYEAESFLLSAVFIGFAFVASVAIAPVSRMKALVRSPFCWGLGAFWLLAFVSVAASEVQAISFVYFVFFSALPLSFLTVALHPFGGVMSKGVLIGACCVLCILAIFAAISYFAIPEMLFYGQVHWPLSNPNSFAGLMSLALWAAVALGLLVKTPAQIALSAFHALLFFAVMLMTGSLGALLANALVFAVFLLIGWPLLKDKKRYLAFIVVGCVLLNGMFSLPSQQLSSTMGEVGPNVEMLSTRPALWQSALDIAEENQWTGTGIGTFFLYYPEVRSSEDAGSAGLMAHSDPLQFAVEMGLAAPVVFYVLVLLFLGKLLRVRFDKDVPDQTKLIILCLCAGLGVVFVHAHVTFHFYVLSLLMLMGAGLGLWFSLMCTSHASVDGAESPHESPLARIVFSVLLISVLAFFSQLQSGQVHANFIQKHLVEGDVDGVIEHVNEADRLSFGTNARAYVSAANITIGMLQLNAPLMAKDDLNILVGGTERLLEKAHRHNPRSANMFYAWGELRAYTQPFLRIEDRRDDKQAYIYFEDALKLDPLHLPSRLKLIDRAVRSKDFDKAFVLYEEGLKWRYRAQNPRLFLEKAGRLALDKGRSDIYEDAQSQWSLYFSEPYPLERE